MHHRALVLLVLSFAACSRDGQEAADQAAAAPAAQAAPVAPSEPEEAFVTGVTGLRRQPTDDKQVDDAQKPGKKVANWTTTLHRGELVQVLKVQDAWAQVRASDETQGWLKKDDLLPTEGVTMATVLLETKTFDRPDLLALNTKRKLEPATLLYLTKTKEQFSEVNYGGTATAWVISESLNTEKREVDASKIINKARWLEKKNDATAAEIMDLAKTQFADTKLVQAITGNTPTDAQAPAPEGTATPTPGAAPGAAPTPATPPAGSPTPTAPEAAPKPERG